MAWDGWRGDVIGSWSERRRSSIALTIELWKVAEECWLEWPAGTLTRNFKHLAVDMYIIEEEGQKKLKVEAHFGKRKALAAIRTAISHVDVRPLAARTRMPCKRLYRTDST